MLLLWSMYVQFTKTGTSVMVMINMILARIFMKKWMIHDVHILSQLMRILLIVFQLLRRIAGEEEKYQNWISIDKNTCDELGINGYCKNERKYCNAQFVTATEACYCAVGSHEG